MGVDPFTLGMIGFGIASAGMSVASGFEAKKRSEKQAEAIRLENEIKTNEKARQVQRQAGSQRASFLASGITLTGEGSAQDVIGETYQFGLEDINLMNKNSITQQENVLSKGRSEFIAGLGKGALSLGKTFMPFVEFGGLGDTVNQIDPTDELLDVTDWTGGVA